MTDLHSELTKTTDHSNPHGLLQIQFAIKNLRTTQALTD